MCLYHDTSACFTRRVACGARLVAVVTHQACLDGQRQRRTFWLSEVALFNTSLEGAVEHRVELGLARVLDLVVGLDVLLDGLTAVIVDKSQLVSQVQNTASSGVATEMCNCEGSELTCCHFSL